MCFRYSLSPCSLLLFNFVSVLYFFHLVLVSFFDFVPFRFIPSLHFLSLPVFIQCFFIFLIFYLPNFIPFHSYISCLSFSLIPSFHSYSFLFYLHSPYSVPLSSRYPNLSFLILILEDPINSPFYLFLFSFPSFHYPYPSYIHSFLILILQVPIHSPFCLFLSLFPSLYSPYPPLILKILQYPSPQPLLLCPSGCRRRIPLTPLYGCPCTRGAAPAPLRPSRCLRTPWRTLRCSTLLVASWCRAVITFSGVLEGGTSGRRLGREVRWLGGEGGERREGRKGSGS